MHLVMALLARERCDLGIRSFTRLRHLKALYSMLESLTSCFDQLSLLLGYFCYICISREISLGLVPAIEAFS